jgi:hypothetical protein
LASLPQAAAIMAGEEQVPLLLLGPLLPSHTHCQVVPTRLAVEGMGVPVTHMADAVEGAVALAAGLPHTPVTRAMQLDPFQV